MEDTVFLLPSEKISGVLSVLKSANQPKAKDILKQLKTQSSFWKEWDKKMLNGEVLYPMQKLGFLLVEKGVWSIQFESEAMGLSSSDSSDSSSDSDDSDDDDDKLA
jgi:hypothetical protein